MTKTLNQIIIFFPPPKSEYFFQQHWESEYFSICYKRNICLYEKGNYDDLRRDLQSVQWDTLIIENDVNQSVTNVTSTILQIALFNVPNKAITIRTNEALGSQMT